jgi:hypothetical protein
MCDFAVAATQDILKPAYKIITVLKLKPCATALVIKENVTNNLLMMMANNNNNNV